MAENTEKKILTVPADEKKRVDIFIKNNSDLSRGQVQKLIDYRKVFVNGRNSISYHSKVKTGDVIEYTADIPDSYSVERADIPLNIIYEDEYILGINKQPGLVVHPAPGHTGDTLVNALVGKYIKKESYFSEGTRLGIVHRLDKDTSGVMIVAKNNESYLKLSSMFREKEMKKVYACLVHGEVAESGYINTNINRDTKNRRKFTARYAGGKEAHTIFSPERIFYGATLLNVKILTGRTHQIRVHMNFLKHEVIGDPQYGDKGKDIQLLEYLGFGAKSHLELMNRQMLHAKLLEFKHPFTGEKTSLTAPMPDDFMRLQKLLENKKGPA